ncbi:MAG: serine hydrolase [Methylacidiphilales bacterium]|nr:serine hydrolase [Candidatus Methylacidiphilales bacterium]
MSPKISANTASIQQTIQSLLQQLIADGTERGMQVAAYCEGRLVVDAWAGIANHQTGMTVDGDTLFPVFSVSKGLAATVVHRLVERGELSYDSPIAEIWPEFTAHGKERITLRQGLSHTAGLPYMPKGIGYAELADWKRMCAAIAGLTPAWTPGSRAQYHAITYGWIVGEPACRATGHSFPDLLQEEIVKPLGMEAMYLGIPDQVESRVALLEDYNKEFVPPDDTQPQSIPGWTQPLHTMMNRPDMWHACLPATTGIMSARALARHYAALLPGGVDGVELLPPERVFEATAWQKLDAPAKGYSDKLLGYQPVGEFEPGRKVARFGHGGHGGAIGFADLERRLAVAVTKNLFNKHDSTGRILLELDKAFPGKE